MGEGARFKTADTLRMVSSKVKIRLKNKDNNSNLSQISYNKINNKKIEVTVYH